MDEKTLTALRGSIAKWEAIVAGTGTDRGAENCPLCHLFIKDGCQGCPVLERSKQSGCKGTPYEDYIHAYYYEDRKSRMIEGAKAELAFLRSLLPEER
jgi:hypothetical protein